MQLQTARKHAAQDGRPSPRSLAVTGTCGVGKLMCDFNFNVVYESLDEKQARRGSGRQTMLQSARANGMCSGV
jgi:hypothetical protein